MASWLIRSERVVLPDGMRPATIHVDDGRITAITRSGTPGTAGHARGTLIDAGSAGGHARPRRYARPHQRARPRRLGRLRDRDARRRGRRHHHARRHAAQQHSVDDHRRRARSQAARRGGPLPCRCRILGRRRARQRRATSSRSRAPACSASSAFSVRRASTNSITSAKPTCARRCRSSRRPACRCWCTPSGRRCCASPIGAPIRAATRRGSTAGPATAEQAAIDLLIDLVAPHLRARAHRPPRLRRCARVDWRRAGQRRADHRRDLSALPDVLRRRHRRRRYGVEVRAADSRDASIASGCGARWPTGTSTWSRPIIRRRRRRSSTSRTATSSRHGAALRRCKSRCRWSGPAPRRGGSRSSGWRSGCPPRRRSSPVSISARARSRPGYDADLVIFDPDREMIVDASRLYHRHAVTPYDGARLRGV